MPIRINLLAEAQAAEELRRRDPVKRTALIVAGLVIVTLAWSGSLQTKALFARSELNRIERQISTRSNDFRAALEQQQQLDDTRKRLTALVSLSTNRLLYGDVLNAFQKSVVPDVQVVRLKAEQVYFYREAVKARTNKTSGKITAPKPATSTEKILLTVDARDTGAVPGDQVNKYRGALIAADYFKQALQTNEVRLANLSAPQLGPDGKAFVLFSLECKYPEKTR
jgi:hypothetical protein